MKSKRCFYALLLVTMHVPLMGASCETYSASSEAFRVEIADLPPSVYAEAIRITAIPDGEMKLGETKKLIVKLRRSELRKSAALKSAVRYHSRLKAHLRKRGAA